MKNEKLKLTIKNMKTEWGGAFTFGLVILVLFFFLRLFNLTLLPIFADEAIYIRWSQVMRAEPTLRFLPLSDGKQPLYMWLTIPFLKIFSDPLFAGRFLSVLCGLGSLGGLFLLSLELFKEKRIALVSSLLYAVIPFFVFFDRMALVDSMLGMLGIWVFYFGVLLIRFLRLDLAMITGMILGAALITKSPAIFFVILLPTILLIAPWIDLKKKGKMVVYLIKLVGLWSVTYIFALGIYNLLRLGPNFHMIALRNKDYVFSFSEILSHPLDPLKPHLGDLAEWLPNLLTCPVILVGLIGIGGGLKRKIKETLCLLIWAVFPLLVQSVFAKVFTPRYILFTIWPLLIFASLGAINLSSIFISYFELARNKLAYINMSYKKIFIWGLILILLIPCLWYDWQLLTSPEKAPLPRKMRSGYLEEWTAGQGIKEIADFVKEKAKTSSVFVGTEGFFGTLPDGLQIYLEKTPNVTVIGVGVPISQVSESLINSLVDNEVYLVVNQSRLLIPPEAYGLKLIRGYPKAVNPEGKQDKLLLFEVQKVFWQPK